MTKLFSNVCGRVRMQIAEERGLPSFMIFHDSTLREMARERPVTVPALSLISKVGSKKAADFGLRFVAEIKKHLG